MNAEYQKNSLMTGRHDISPDELAPYTLDQKSSIIKNDSVANSTERRLAIGPFSGHSKRDALV